VKDVIYYAKAMQKLDSNTFDVWLKGQQPFDAKSPRLDLKGYGFVSSAALVQLAALVYSLAGAKVRPSVELDDESVLTYLSRSGFCSAISPVGGTCPMLNQDVYGGYRGSNPMLLEVTRIESCAMLPELLDKILWVLNHRLRYPKFDAYNVATIISEITQNTFDHNDNTYAFIAMQVYESHQSHKAFLEIGIADHGRGLAETLRRNPKYKSITSDSDAIKVAIKLGTSEHDDPTRGTGLYHLVETTYKHEGLVQVRSGQAKIRYRMDKKQGWMFPVPPMPGVQIALNFPSKN
jgi:hypothetical protein